MVDAALANVPPRSTSRYDGRYRDCVDARRLIEILQDSLRIAAQSKVPETARARFELAVEVFHQLSELELPEDFAREVARHVGELARHFPSTWRVNAARGLQERGGRAALATTRRRYLDEALAVVDAGLAEGAGDVEALKLARAEVERAINALGGGAVGGEPAVAATAAPTLTTPPAQADGELVARYAEVSEAERAEDLAPEEVEAEHGITLTLLERLHVALLDNGLPVVLDCQVRNGSAEAITGGRLVIEGTNGLVERLEVELGDLEPLNGHVQVGRGAHPCPLRIDRATFEGLTERVRGEVVARVLDSEGRERMSTRVEIEALPRDHWPGLAVVPELLAAFVVPNDSSVAALVQRAAQHVNTATGSPSLDGYQSKDPQRVLHAVAAVYAALQELGATYLVAPASFESSGQRVRLPGQIATGKQANCLDIALFAASAIEAIGLHPLLVVVEGHAFTGVWLEEETYPDPVVEEVLRLTKRIELRDVAVFDPVAVLSRPSVSFDEARAIAQRHLDRRQEFLAAVDVRRARLGRVLPLGSARVDGDEALGVANTISSTASTRDVEEAMRERLAADRQRSIDEAPASRVDRWLRQLLDLSMRNRLLNCEGSRRSIPLLGAHIARLEDLLSDGMSFRVLPKPSELELDRLGPQTRSDRSVVRETLAPVLDEGMARGELRADLSIDELDKRMLAIYREALTAREEGGANSLFLAVGFLDFYEDRRSSRRRRAPLLLVPLELRRGSLREGFRLTRSDDETRLNVTLLEYLLRVHQIEVAGLDSLPEDESGVDVPLVLRLVREAIKREDRWEVAEESAIGLFSFSKFLVWRDLRDRGDELKRNQLVRHLIDTPRAAYDDGVEVPALETLDHELTSGEALCPLSADSSQLRAVLAAARGKTLVLEGPPGTGKSQTIANLIAHSLATGRSVLFVSEKMAALEVVHRRLRQVGLGEACLELHSNKANKKAVLEQFREALDFTAKDEIDGWERLVGNLLELRQRLNGHVSALHRRRTSGESVHDVLARISELADAPEIPYTFGEPREADAEQLSQWRESLSEFSRQALEQGLAPQHPLLDVGCTRYSPLWERDALAAIEACADRADELLAVARPLVAELLDGVEPQTDASWSAMVRAFGAAVAPPPLGPNAVRCFARPDVLEQVRASVALARDLADREARLDADFRESPTTLDLEQLEQLRRERAATWFFPAWLRGRKLRGALRGLARRPESIDVDAAIAALDEARKVVAQRKELDAASGVAEGLLGSTWRGVATDTGAARAALAWLDAVGAGVRAAGEAERAVGDAVASTLEQLLANDRDKLAPDGFVERAVTQLAEARAAFDAARRAVQAAVEPTGSVAEPTGLGGVEQLHAACVRWSDAWSGVRGWCRYRTARDAAVAAGLEALVLRVESGALAPPSIERAFERSFAEAWTFEEVSDDPALRAFDGTEHQVQVDRFVELDERHIEQVRGVLRRRLEERATVRANQSRAAKDSELGILVHELTKKTRHKAIRKLLQEISGVALQLKPCFLMSPMSVAQYLDTSFPPFDLVVFDEASQIPVWDAIGALARGVQAVVVGDPKQLPPTSFFSRSDDETVGEDEIEDLESILDECMGAQVPTLRLAWHYRSRHESLIAFSNERYYGNNLLTFPANSDVDLGVSWRHLEHGVYDMGGTRTNEVEARAIADEVVRRLVDPRLSGSTIGVVTFSQPQQTLVQDLLDEAQRTHPAIERFFAVDNDEAVFVKNLENVQGDERDVILFSIGYGPDARGRISMNFGPLNKAGGQRRLNVAVTRARREIVVFTSMRAHQIDLSRTRAEGVRDLKAFLEYVEKAGAESAHETPVSHRASSRIVESVAAELRARGHTVDLEVGCSGYRIDLAVRDPEQPGEYLLGIETDGPNYKSAATARDRDSLRRQVLEGLGWSLHRVWAIEWWRDTALQLAHVEAALASARERRRAAAIAPAALAAALEDTAAVEPSEEVLAADAVHDAPPVRPVDADAPVQPGDRARGLHRPLERGRLALDQTLFYESAAEPAIRQVVREVIEFEAPIVREQLVKRVSELWGFQRVRKKGRERIEALLDGLGATASEFEGQVVYWRDAAQRNAFGMYRLSAPGHELRAIEELPVPELAAALLEALEQSGAMGVEPLVRAALSSLGSATSTAKRRDACERALRWLRAQERVALDGDRVRALPRPD